MKQILFSLCLLTFCLTSQAQKHIIKVRPLQLAFGNLQAGYEFKIAENKTLALNGGFRYKNELPQIAVDYLEDEEIATQVQVRSLSFHPEIRFYTNKSKGAPRGFYVAPFLKFNRYGTAFETVVEEEMVNVDLDVNTIGAGLQLGAQWFIGDVVSIDWYFLGFGIDRHNAKAVYQTNITTDYKDFAEEVEAELEDAPIIGNRIEVEALDNGVSVSAPFLFPGFRAGLSLGIAF